MNIRIVSPNFLDDTDYLIKEFKSDFYKQFNVFPESEAYEGFDMMSYLGTNLIEHGSKFDEAIENKEIEMLTTGYRLSRKIRKSKMQIQKLTLPVILKIKNCISLVLRIINLLN